MWQLYVVLFIVYTAGIMKLTDPHYTFGGSQYRTPFWSSFFFFFFILYDHFLYFRQLNIHGIRRLVKHIRNNSTIK